MPRKAPANRPAKLPEKFKPIRAKAVEKTEFKTVKEAETVILSVASKDSLATVLKALKARPAAANKAASKRALSWA